MFGLPFLGKLINSHVPTMSRATVWVILVGLLINSLPPGKALSSDLAADAQLKSKYILNFAKLVEWPKERVSPNSDNFLIGILGDPYLWNASRRELSGERIRGSKVALAPMSLEKAMAPDPEMKILFIYTNDAEEMKSIIAALADRPILLVSDYPGFCQLGGSIGLVWEQGRLLFDINRRQELRTGLKMNSRLLQVARGVIE